VAEFVTLVAPGRRFKAGLYHYPDTTGNDSTQALTASRNLAVPFTVGQRTTFVGIGCEVTIVSAGSTIRLGIYSDTGRNYPGALVLDAGTIDSAVGTGAKEITISQVLAPARYWLTLCAQGGTPTIRTRINTAPAIGMTAISNSNEAHFYETGVTAALPASFTSSVAVANTHMPKIALKAS